MGDDTQNTKATAEDLAIERAEHQLADPAAANMQFLQSTLDSTQFDSLGANSGFFNASGKPVVPTQSSSSQSYPGLAPAYSGAGLLGAVAAVDMSGASSAMGMVAQVASAAPVTFGKTAVGDSANLSALGNKALAQSADLSKVSEFPLPKSLANLDGNMVPVSPEFAQLIAMLEGGGSSVNPNDALMSLINGLGQTPNAENLQAAIDAVLGQIELLNDTFEPLLDGLAGDVQSEMSLQNSLPSTDLGVSILDDAGDLSNTLTDLLGTVDIGANPQLNGLLNLDSTFDDISSLVGSLPDLDLTPVTDPVTDIVGGITDGIGGVTDGIGGVTDGIGGVTDGIGDVIDGITDPITDIVTDITDPVTDIVTDITDPVTDIVTDITDPLLDPILGGEGGLLSGLSSSSSSDSDVGLLDSLSSGISSSAGSEGGALDGLLGSLDQNK